MLWHEFLSGRQPKESDAYDRKHVAYAAYADLFVTEDRELRNTMTSGGWLPDRFRNLSGLIACLKESPVGVPIAETRRLDSGEMS